MIPATTHHASDGVYPFIIIVTNIVGIFHIFYLADTVTDFVVDIAVVLRRSGAGGINGSQGIIHKVLIRIFLLGDAGFEGGCFPT